MADGPVVRVFRELGEEPREFTLISVWRDLASLRACAGDDRERPVLHGDEATAVEVGLRRALRAVRAVAVSPRLLACLVLAAPLLVAGAAAAAPARPSERGCLLAWNAPSNGAARARLLALRPPTGLSLLPGRTVTLTWTRGSTPRQRASEACLLTLARPGEIRVVTGVWSGGRVTHWSFGRSIATARSPFANVRLLPDGRLTKPPRR